METGFLHRPIGDALLERTDVPVLILEGARAVGKTTLAKSQLVEAGYSYVTLADRATLEFASQDPQGWAQRLPRPVIIDEAQLVKELPLVLKEIVDGLPLGNHFILTGSASIGRQGLGGADPLVRRADRLTMYPLTAWELGGHPGSIVDLLFDADIAWKTTPEITDKELLDDFAFGGFPGYVLQREKISRRRLRERIMADRVASLSRTALPPGELVNTTIAFDCLDAVLRVPGGIFTTTRVSQITGLDSRTIDRYMEIFGRLFLIEWLVNVSTSPAKQAHTRAKIHPVDTSLTVESLERAGASILGQRELFGQLLESYVATQIIPALGWAEGPVTAHFWRQAGKPVYEVDIVIDRYGGQSVGIEVKASSRLAPSDIKGLRALRERRGMTRGFVVYTGTEIQELDHEIWALPISCLYGPGWVA
ncbi:MAG: AAA family ATPase [Propionibacteriaceae bacterium]|jgi:predicted AAA+ superfamily ATPase|nr:AAA family ATPase [Propionibacteriaceae bacterium]